MNIKVAKELVYLTYQTNVVALFSKEKLDIREEWQSFIKFKFSRSNTLRSLAELG